MNRFIEIISVIAILAVIITFIWALFFLLYNAVVANVFGAPELTFWQSVGLLILIGMVGSAFRSLSK